MRAFDPRVTPARADLAAKALEGKVSAGALRRGPRHGSHRAAGAAAPRAAARRAARHRSAHAASASRSTKAMPKAGPGVSSPPTVMSAGCRRARWRRPVPPPTHKVAALRTFAFPGPSIKLPPIEALPLGARIAVARIADRMAVTQAALTCRRRISNRSAKMNRTSSRWRSGFWALLIFGAARPRSGSTARVSCRSRSPPAASPVRATATCRKQALGKPVATGRQACCQTRRPHILERPRRHCPR